MRFGNCVGLTGVGDCVYSNWSPNWLAESIWEIKFRQFIGSLEHGEPGHVGSLCPICLVTRIPTSGPTSPQGFNSNKKTSLLLALETQIGNCWVIGGSQLADHTHFFSFESGQMMDLITTGIPDIGVRSY